MLNVIPLNITFINVIFNRKSENFISDKEHTQEHIKKMLNSEFDIPAKPLYTFIHFINFPICFKLYQDNHVTRVSQYNFKMYHTTHLVYL